MPDAETIPYGETQTRCSVYPNLAILFKEIEDIANFATYCEATGAPLPHEFNSVAELTPLYLCARPTGLRRPGKALSWACSRVDFDNFDQYGGWVTKMSPNPRGCIYKKEKQIFE